MHQQDQVGGTVGHQNTSFLYSLMTVKEIPSSWSLHSMFWRKCKKPCKCRALVKTAEKAFTRAASPSVPKYFNSASSGFLLTSEDAKKW